MPPANGRNSPSDVYPAPPRCEHARFEHAELGGESGHLEISSKDSGFVSLGRRTRNT